MTEWVEWLFSWVCRQAPEHTWMPGGVALVCCQRCTGLYVGAASATLLHVLLRPPLTARFLQLHGLMLLLMAPLGFHWVPHGAALRTLSGWLFGFGVVTFLWGLPASGFGAEAGDSRRASGVIGRRYFLGLSLGGAILLYLARWGGAPSAGLLSGLCAAGFAALASLIAANLGCGLLVARGWRRGRRQRKTV